MTTTTTTINITVTEYEGNDFPEAAHWHTYVRDEVSRLCAEAGISAEIDVSYGLQQVIHSARGPEAEAVEAIARDVLAEGWETFCASDYSAYQHA